MRCCRVIGTVVATAHHPTYDGRKVLLVRPERPDGEPAGDAFLAVDHVQAGAGDQVLVLTEGNGVRQLLGKDAGPIRSIIVGVIDAVDLGAGA
ncbi:MAG: EutN/CcmL family microcompartment protein [Deltaproteobacteria bacterium]|nr:EutN/CcmL family microcompartment protein [Deltaproteobacteria bacterium]